MNRLLTQRKDKHIKLRSIKKRIWIGTLIATVMLAGQRQSSAQGKRGFVGFGVSSDLNGQAFPGIGGGMIFGLFNSQVSVGFQGELFFSGGYAAGRGGPIGQANFMRHRNLQPFAVGGYAWGEDSGPMFGGGIEWWGDRRIGLRASVEDHVRLEKWRAHPGHQPAARFGIVWR